MLNKNFLTKSRWLVTIILLLSIGVGHAWGTDASLTQSEITTNITNTTCAYGTTKTYNDTGDGVTWVASCYTDAASRKWMQLKKDATAYIKITVPSGNKITNVSVTITSATNSSGGINDITKHTDYANGLYVRSSATGTPATSPIASTTTISSDVMSVSVGGTYNEVYIQVDKGARVWGISVTYVASSTTVSLTNGGCDGSGGTSKGSFLLTTKICTVSFVSFVSSKNSP